MTEITDNKLDTQDIPIISSKDDKLDRSKIVDSIITAINSHDGKHSLTIGIEGPWGSGKTSIINLVKDKIESDKDHKNKYVILDFNPWMHMGTEQILVDFFRSISQAIIKGLPDESEISEKVKGLLTGITISLNLGLVSAQKNFDAKLDEPTLGKQKKDLADILSGLDKKVICIIDDIDRLDADETLLIFKLTKIIANFPNMIFVLAYDRRRTASLISQKMNTAGTSTIEDDDMGDKFIQKIVQVVRPVPYSADDIKRKYFNGLIMSANFYQDPDDVGHLYIKEAYDKYLKNIIQTPRDMKRLISHVSLFLKANEVYFIRIKDLLLIEAIRITEGNLYENIKDNKEVLIGEYPLNEGEISFLNHYLQILSRALSMDISGIKTTGVDYRRCETIKTITEVVSETNRINMVKAIRDVLSCKVTLDDITLDGIEDTQNKIYQHLCDGWDLYFSVGTASVNMDE